MMLIKTDNDPAKLDTAPNLPQRAVNTGANDDTGANTATAKT
jgi:hypothetical protein